jgi:RsiW-degrading membrane proteinase PrsW (M82 family)
MTTTRTTILSVVFPFRIWLHAAALRRRTSLLFALFVGYPLLAGWFILQQFHPISVEPNGALGPDGLAALSHDLKWLDWPFVAYFGVAWLVAIWAVVRPRLTALPAAAVAGVGLLIGGPIAIWLEDKLHARTGNLVSAVFAVGGSEELAKMLAVLAVLIVAMSVWHARQHEVLGLSPKAFLYLGVVSGVAFGCAEAVSYIVSEQYKSIAGQDSILSLTEVVFGRLITDPINHALWAGVSCFFLGLAVQRARQRNRLNVSGLLEQSWLIGLGLAIAAVLHGLHDFSGNPVAQACIDTASAFLLLGYALAGDVVERAVAAAPGPQWASRSGQRASAPAYTGASAPGYTPPAYYPPPAWLPPPAGAQGYPPSR